MYLINEKNQKGQPGDVPAIKGFFFMNYVLGKICLYVPVASDNLERRRESHKHQGRINQ